tara:strand:- start:264 stop:572 length:309 start_codon:yes stop_codon:yes gene_type:complete
MEEVNNILNPPQKQNWDEQDNFASKTLEKGEGIVKDVIDGAKETFELAVQEAKTVAPDVVEVFEESSERLNSQDRITKLIPNNYLVFGVVLLASYIIVKKVL